MLAGLGMIAAGMGQSFVPAMQNAQAMQLERQKMQFSQQREMMARADKVRAEMWDFVSENINAMRAAGSPPADIMKNMAPWISRLEDFTQKSGFSKDMVAPQVAMILARPVPEDIIKKVFGKSGQAPGSAGTQPDTAFAGAPNVATPGLTGGGPQGTASVPFVQPMTTGGQPEGAPSAQGVMPQAPPVPGMGQQQLQQQGAGPSLDEQIDAYGRAMELSRTPAEKDKYKYVYEQLVRKKFSSHGHIQKNIIKTDDGYQVIFTNMDTMKSINQNGEPWPPPNQAAAAAEDYTPIVAGLPPPNPKMMKALEKTGTTAEILDRNAMTYLLGNTSVVTGTSRIPGYRVAVQNRAQEIAKAMGLSPAQVNRMQVEFKAQLAGATTLGRVAARQVESIDKARPLFDNVINLSEQIDRTKYPSLNAAILAFKKGTGDATVVRFANALHGLAVEIGLALGQGNSVLTDSMTKRADDMLEQNLSKYQLREALDQTMLQMELELGGVRQGIKDFLDSSPTTGGGTEMTPPHYQLPPSREGPLQSTSPRQETPKKGNWSVEMLPDESLDY